MTDINTLSELIRHVPMASTAHLEDQERVDMAHDMLAELCDMAVKGEIMAATWALDLIATLVGNMVVMDQAPAIDPAKAMDSIKESKHPLDCGFKALDP